MNNAALAKALESAQLIELDPRPGSRASPANEPLTKPASLAAQRPPLAAARSILNALWRRPPGTCQQRAPLPPLPDPEPALPLSAAGGLRLPACAAPQRNSVSASPSAAAQGSPEPSRAMPQPTLVPLPPSVVLPVPPSDSPRGLLHALWLRLFGPPSIDPSTVSRDFGAFRAFYEVGSDYLPSSGTWPSAGGFTSDRS